MNFTRSFRKCVGPLSVALLVLPLALAGGGCGSKTLKNLTRQHITHSKGNTPLRQKYDRLSKGMTEADVVALMGPPAREKTTQSDGYTFTVLTYEEGDWKAVVAISPKHGLLVAHSSDDPDFGKK